jgi:hypothetical protein
MQDSNFNIDSKPVGTIPASPLTDFNDDIVIPRSKEEIEDLTELAREHGANQLKLGADDITNIVEGLAEQKSLQALGMEPNTNTNFSLKTVAIVAAVIGLIVAAIKIFG